MTTHIVLISDQILQNLIPLLMEKPASVCFVISRRMAERGADRHLANQLRDTGMEIRRFPDCPDTGLPDIKAFAEQVAEAALAGGPEDAVSEIVLNATGGTKLMSLGFVEALRGIATRIIYTDTAHQRIETLSTDTDPDGDAARPPAPMVNVLDVPAYLSAQGFNFRRAQSDDAAWQLAARPCKPAAKWLGKMIADAHLQHFISNMNRLVNQALQRIPERREERLVAAEQGFSSPPRGIWREAMIMLSAAGLLDWPPGSSHFRFVSLEAAQFIRGGWLEEYAFHTLADEGVFDARLGVEGAWDRKQTITNEFDALACDLNQLLVIECKTGRFDPGQNDNDIAYKLDSLGDDARGLFGSTWLLCAREPTGILVARARRANIRLIPPAELANLRDLVREWRG